MMLSCRALWLLPALVLLAACARSGPSDHTSAAPVVVPDVSEPAPGEPAKPIPTGPIPPALIGMAPNCKWNHPAPELGAALEQYVGAALAKGGEAGLESRLKAEEAGCLVMGRAPDGPVLLVKSGDLGPVVVAWQSGDRWQVSLFEKRYSDTVYIGRVRMVEGRPEGFLIGSSTGSGGARSILHLTVDPTGKATAKPVTDVYARSNIDFFGPDLALITHRDKLWKEFPDSCNGCVPSLEQVLLRWNGTRFQVSAERMIPDPELTLNHLRIALEQGDQSTAAGLVSDQALLSQARELLRSPERRQYVEFDHGRGPVFQYELYNWNLLPDPNRTPLPPELQHISYVVEQGGRFALQLKRTPEWWVLAGIQPLKPGEVPADAPKE